MGGSFAVRDQGDQASRGEGGGEGSDHTSVSAFLIADVRGYTLFTQQHGDEAAAKLAAKFAGVARAGIEARGGTLLELRGDEALAVFDSPRAAIRAAMDLQERFVEETEADPEIPLLVGMGMDAGEAVPVEGGYRGGALNLAARLCGLAAPGEILASRELAHLARRMDGVTFEDAGPQTMKGFTEPVHVIRLVPTTGTDPKIRLEPFRPPAPAPTSLPEAPRRHRRRIAALIAAGVALVLIAVGIPLITGRSSSRGLPSVEANSLGILDPATGRIVDQVRVGGTPSGVAVGAGSIWVTVPGNDSVARIDPDRRTVVDTIPVGDDPNGIAATADAIWVANSGAGTVSRIDPKIGQVVGSYSVGNGPYGVAVGHGAVWVTNRVDDTLVKLDAKTGAVAGAVPVGGNPSAVAIGTGAVWVSNSGTASVSRIDAATLTVTESVTVGNGPRGLAVSKDALWVANSLDGTVSRVDPGTGSVTATVPVGDGPAGVSLVGGAVWVSNEFGGTVTGLDRGSTSIARTVPMGNLPVGLSQEGGLLLVPVRGGTKGHLGGTLNLVSDQGLDFIDPARAYFDESWQVLIMTNDGLVGFERVGGAEGTNLVPDLATSLPAPTSNGTSYSFQLRSGIHYSNGVPVKASDVRGTLEREFKLKGPGRGYYSGIVGAASCMKRPATCSLASGILTNDAQATVTFHLTAPDPEFMFKLALPFAFLVPGDTPDRTATTPLPATGPYEIAKYTPGHEVVLGRNPRFREWSAAAQPQGFPDRIVLRTDVERTDGVTMVESGQADWMYSGPPVDQLEDIRTQFASQLHGSPSAATYFMQMNTRTAPFDRLDVRRALNFAVDRSHVVALAGGSDQAVATCQILPPNFPGYLPYCPFTSDPSEDGTWKGPDLAAARRLIGSSGTKGMAVVVWGAPLSGGHAVAEYFVSLLRSLGYPASLHYETGFTKYFEHINDATHPVQIAFSGWLADYSSAFSFISAQLTCAAITTGPGNSNGAEFCDPKVESLIRQAQEVQGQDPAAAGASWAEVDQAITDAAPYVNLFNPKGIDFLSARAGNWQHHPQWELLLDQLWVR